MAIIYRKILLLLLLATIAGGCTSSIKKPTVLNRDTVWSGEVTVQGDLILEKGSRLTVLPGTDVVFYPAGNKDHLVDHPHFAGSELIVRGSIIAEGTAEQPITFRYIDPDAPAGSWGGVNLMASVESSFEYVLFQQADSAIHSQESRVYIEQSIFENNLVAVRFHSSEILIENNLIRNNDTGIRFHFGKPVICKNDIIDNKKGFFITSHPYDYLIENNTILKNERNVVLGEEVPENVLMARNYWGTTDDNAIRLTFFDKQIEPYLGIVQYEPLRSAPDSTSGVKWSR
jgi:hypothetical protein